LLVVQSLQMATGILLISPQQLRFQAVCVLVLVVTNLPLSWWLAGMIGPAGPVWASVITVAACQTVPAIVVASRATSTRAAARDLIPETAHG
jgi:O-antigen/teichoic acid export membrane protein